jgi:hypothetical protein
MDSKDRQVLGDCLDRIVDEALAAIGRGEHPVVFRPYLESRDNGVMHSSTLGIDTNILVRRCMNTLPITMPLVASATTVLASAAGGVWADELDARTPDHYGGSRAFEALMGLAAGVLNNCVEGASRDGQVAGAIDRFERFCEMREVAWTVSVPLLGVSVTDGPHSLSDGVVIRAADEQFKQALWAAHGPGAGYGDTLAAREALTVAGIEAVLEMAISTERDGWLPYAEADKLINPVITAMRIYNARHLTSLVQWMHGPQEIEGLSKAPVSSLLGARADLRAPPFEMLAIDTDRARDIRAWIEHYQTRAPDDALGFAIQRFNLCDERKSDDDRLVDAWIALESLLSRKSETEVSYRVALRLATLIGGSASERKATRALAKVSYDLRSEIVHGTPPAKRKPKKPVDEIVRETEDLVRKTLRLWVLGSYKIPEEVISQLEDRVLDVEAKSNGRNELSTTE